MHPPAFLFVYGTLRSGSDHTMGRFLMARAELIGEALLHGNLFDFGWHPGVRVPGSGQVRGEVYKVRPESAVRVLEDLDRYEGCGPEDPLPHLFDRHTLRVTLLDGQELDALVYLPNQVPAHAVLIPSGDWLNR